MTAQVFINDVEGCEMIERYILNKFKDVSKDQFISKSRKKELVAVRHIIFFFQAYFTRSTFKYIGSRCGDRDHSSIMCAKDRVCDRMDYDLKYKDEIMSIGRGLFGENFNFKWSEFLKRRKVELKEKSLRKRFVEYEWIPRVANL